MTKVMTVVGTRPEIIRLSRVIDRLDRDRRPRAGAHRTELRPRAQRGLLRRPRRCARPTTSSTSTPRRSGAVLGGVLIETEEVLLAERPDAVLVLGDTNSCIAAVMAKRMRIPVYHMEAGNRCFDENVPEETNRRLVDHVADFNLVYTEHARRNLLAEGLHPRRILLTGSPMREVLEHYRPQIDASDVLDRLGPDAAAATSWSARTARRTSTTPTGCGMLLDCLERGARAVGAAGARLDASAHPQAARGAGRGSAAADIALPGAVRLPRLQPAADRRPPACSRTAARSPRSRAILGFPAVTLRDSIERPEALDAGAIIMTGLDPERRRACGRRWSTRSAGPTSVPAEYRDRHQRAGGPVHRLHGRPVRRLARTAMTRVVVEAGNVRSGGGAQVTASVRRRARRAPRRRTRAGAVSLARPGPGRRLPGGRGQPRTRSGRPARRDRAAPPAHLSLGRAPGGGAAGPGGGVRGLRAVLRPTVGRAAGGGLRRRDLPVRRTPGCPGEAPRRAPPTDPDGGQPAAVPRRRPDRGRDRRCRGPVAGAARHRCAPGHGGAERAAPVVRRGSGGGADSVPPAHRAPSRRPGPAVPGARLPAQEPRRPAETRAGPVGPARHHPTVPRDPHRRRVGGPVAGVPRRRREPRSAVARRARCAVRRVRRGDLPEPAGVLLGDLRWRRSPSGCRSSPPTGTSCTPPAATPPPTWIPWIPRRPRRRSPPPWTIPPSSRPGRRRAGGRPPTSRPPASGRWPTWTSSTRGWPRRPGGAERTSRGHR